MAYTKNRVVHEVRKCCNCGIAGLAKGDIAFKGLQGDPRSIDMDWFCDKSICMEAMEVAIEAAKVVWAEVYAS